MNTKITLTLNETIIKKSKKYADTNCITLSELVETLLIETSCSNNKE